MSTFGIFLKDRVENNDFVVKYKKKLYKMFWEYIRLITFSFLSFVIL